jgi:ParB/RepB/Spo0J family partition protein
MPLALIRPNPWQPRQHVDSEKLHELTADVAARGVLEPLIVRPLEEGVYQVVAGERRYRAAIGAGLSSVPVIVRDDMGEEEAREVSLVENLLREDLDIEDEARFLRALYEQKKSLRAVGDAIHKSYQYVNRRLKLLEDPATLLAYREGLVKLDDLIAAQSRDDDDLDLAGDPSVTERNRGEMEEVRFYRTRSTFKPFQKLHLHVRRLEHASIAPDERPRLRQTVHELIEELTQFERALAAEEPDVELEEREGGAGGWTVRRADGGNGD